MSRARSITDKIPGGKADTKSPGDFDPKALKAGTAVEMEHVNSKDKAREIAMDHLAEDPNYYKKLSKADLVDEPKAKKLLEAVWKTSPRYPNYKIEQESDTEYVLHHASGIFQIVVQKHPTSGKWWGDVLTQGKGRNTGHWDPVASPNLKKRFNRNIFNIPALASDVDKVAQYLQSEASHYRRG